MSHEIITDKEIENAFKGTNFGHTRYRELLEASVFKKLVGYHCGHTVTCIMQELGLIGKTGKPTKKGIQLVRAAYNDLLKVSG